MSMKFYCGSGSPPAWRVWLGLEHKQLPYELKMLSFSAGDLKSEEFTQLNPRQKVPVLVENGFVLYESVAILEYLDERYPVAGRGRLFPDDARERALVRRFIQETDWYLGMAMGRMLREIFHKAEEERDRSRDRGWPRQARGRARTFRARDPRRLSHRDAERGRFHALSHDSPGAAGRSQGSGPRDPYPRRTQTHGLDGAHRSPPLFRPDPTAALEKQLTRPGRKSGSRRGPVIRPRSQK